MKDITIDSRLQAMIPSLNQSGANDGGGFGDLLAKAISDTNDAQVAADQAVSDFSLGKADNIHDVMIALEEADISMRLLVQMRNKAVEAYQEIIRMQV